MQVNNAIPIKCESLSDFFRKWLSFLTPVHHMTPAVLKVAAELLKHRYLLSSSIANEAILDNYLLTNLDIRNAIMNECNISSSNYHVSIGKLRDAHFIENGEINPRFIPKMTDSNLFGLLVIFKIDNVEKESLPEGSQ